MCQVTSAVSDSATPWTVAHQVPLSMGFSRQEYWSGLLFPSPGDLPDPGIEPRSPTQVSHIVGRHFTIWATREILRHEDKKSKSQVAQSCLTLCNPMDCSLPGSSVRGIFQARILEWVAISFSRRSSQPRDRTQVSCISGAFFTIWTTREAPFSLTSSCNPSFPVVESSLLHQPAPFTLLLEPLILSFPIFNSLLLFLSY